MNWSGAGARVLDFDIECRPMAWYGGDFVTKQPTAIGFQVIGAWKKPRCAYIGGSHDTNRTWDEEAQMLEVFLEEFRKADIVTGHHILGFDLPLVTSALLRHHMPHLPSTLVQDTKAHFVKAHGISKSQENLGALFELEHPKIPMNTATWMEANMLTTKGVRLTRKRVIGDVVQHIEMREEMMRRGLLSRPKHWDPGSLATDYEP